MTVIVDYGLGNLGSIFNMLKKIGVHAVISSETEKVRQADRIILPGVGSFDAGIRNLRLSGLEAALSEKVLNERTPLLGICLGMQLLADGSEEGDLDGLKYVGGFVRKFRFGDNPNQLKIPHMGWNRVIPKRECDLFKNMPQEMRFYFVHSYHFVCDREEDVIAETDYGYQFTSMVSKGNIYGAQFHPEKSHKFGMMLLRNFTEIRC